MTDPKIADLGHDILLYRGEDAAEKSILSSRVRFMNVLWLPCHLSELTVEQISVINRFRENEIERDTQFQQASRSRQALLTVLRAMNVQSVLEIGCGKFPLATELPGVIYRGIEIDEVAVSYCRQKGLDVRSGLKGERKSQKFDVAASLYAFHFSIDEALIRHIEECLGEAGILVFNLIAEEGAYLLNELSSLTKLFPYTRVIKCRGMAKREFFFVMARPSGWVVAREIASAIEGALSSF